MLDVTVKVHVRPVSRFTVTFPVEVTTSEKVTSISITSFSLYDPSAVLDEMLVIVGAVESVAETDTLSIAAALPGVIPVPVRELNRICIVFPTVAGLDVEIELETREP